MCGSRVLYTLPQQQKTFITLRVERKVCIIGVEIRQRLFKIFEPPLKNEAINT